MSTARTVSTVSSVSTVTGGTRGIRGTAVAIAEARSGNVTVVHGT